MSIECCQDLGGYFLSVVDDAARVRRVSLSAPTRAYVAEVLAACAGPGASERLGASLVLQLEQALRPETARDVGQAEALRSVGDAALCRSGLFVGDAPLAVCVRVGQFAYREAALRSHGPRVEALETLGREFTQVVDVVAEVAEATALGAVTRDLVRLYDRWREADSARALERLQAQGLFPLKVEVEG
ncbi:MAG: hypothetical protein JNK72_04765 [Myxococcales bacterium]|nr:hypothetical protein [Myxococcales bacterium]